MNNFAVPILTAILGLIMMFAAEPIITVFVIALGFFLMISGFYILFVMARLLDDKNYKIAAYIRGAASIVLGILCVVLPVAVVNFAWKTMMVILGIYALLSAVMEIYAVIRLRQMEPDLDVKKYVTEILTTLIAAVVLFLLPSSFGFKLIKIFGGLLIGAACVLAVVAYKNRPIIEADAEVVDED